MGHKLTITEEHQLKIAQETLKYDPVVVAIMAGMTIKEAKETIKRLTGGQDNGN